MSSTSVTSCRKFLTFTNILPLSNAPPPSPKALAKSASLRSKAPRKRSAASSE